MNERKWFRCPDWAADWEAWKAAANEVAALEGEVLPWPYNPEPPLAFIRMITMAEDIIKTNRTLLDAQESQ